MTDDRYNVSVSPSSAKRRLMRNTVRPFISIAAA